MTAAFVTNRHDTVIATSGFGVVPRGQTFFRFRASNFREIITRACTQTRTSWLKRFNTHGYAPSKRLIFSPLPKRTIAFFQESGLPTPNFVRFPRPRHIAVFTLLTLTRKNFSTAFLISSLVACLSTSKTYTPFSAKVLSGAMAAARAAFRNYYIVRGRERIMDRLNYYAPKVGVLLRKVDVRELGNRWAFYSPAGNLAFHWKCLMAPPTIIDYIVVHELCHFHHLDHTNAFWNEVDKVLPNYLERKDWLRRNGAGLDI